MFLTPAQTLAVPFLAAVTALASPALGAASRPSSSYLHQPGATRQHHQSVSPMAGVSSEHGAQVGVKGDYLLASPAFVPSLNNAVYAEASLFASREGGVVAPLVRWDFNVHPQWTAYTAVGVEFDRKGASATIQPGGFWRIPKKPFLLRAELTVPQFGVRIGGTLPF